MNIVFCASEVVPFAKTGGLADVAGALPVALEKLGHDVVIFTPRYKTSKLHAPSPIVRIGENVRIYFIEHFHYFDRDGLYGDSAGDYEDNLERFSYFSHQVLKTLKAIKFKPDIVHCHDWHTSLLPTLLRTKYQNDPFFKQTKSVLTIHNLAYQGVFSREQYHKLGVDGNLFHTQGLEFYGKVNVLKGGIIFSDAITTVSPQYAKEIQTPDFGCGLDGVLRNRSKDLHGILNGLDYEAWNPKDDTMLVQQYGAHDAGHRIKNKEALQQTLGLTVQMKAPLFGFVARLCHQKGLDIIIESMDRMMEMGAQCVFTGVGDRKYHRLLEELKERYPDRIGLFLKFDEALAHQIYAGSDFFLMPSVFEPCGLGQMIALRYGSIPIVYKTGGLADTIDLFDPIRQTGNGFLFKEYTKEAFLKAIAEAVKVYRHKSQMEQLIQLAMRYRFSWDKSAKDYVRVYNQCISLG